MFVLFLLPNARNVQEIIQGDSVEGFFDQITKKVCLEMRKHSEEKIHVEVLLFDFDGKILSRYEKT